MLSRIRKLYTKEEFENLLSSFEEEKNICIFLNTLVSNAKILEDEFLKQGLKFRKINAYCYLFQAKDKSILSSMKAFKEYNFYIQNYASYLCALNLDIQEGQSVLDMCAAPGGKSINLANFTQNKAHLVCNEVNKDRFFTLQKNLKNYRVNAKIYMKDGKSIGNLCPLRFDKILLDAPCSTLSKIGFELEKNYKEIKNISKLQKKLLHSALKALKIGGELVYSTCTFTKEENEEVIENALRSEFNIELLDINLENAKAKDAKSNEFSTMIKCKRILPSIDYDGFFIAKLRKLS
ncbi:RsmB/NOP family class I SAM-dependent RNA methyltransferase [Campylobacter hepaticus]|uniref:RsmB/NOP family class I SAM-dependent RNA methyltransferase n=1 Tax=Campylobacter hepaticus TaxID=1813019 RepID=A0A6A7JRW1_9BACT|nr:RsmB/NOP family class I SAM-dependent RNA methyltransferase [Campylobacter hepaticus]AXP08763.1 RsmB/NOP family class I SAM-dependent RNA methyltransferase [Campylobacter hepaticus]MCZ0772613.1 RsmB/NOP family class I SAM-dependent RNA methyltransferase [Campylobacter hepaticus]MCZ0774081.1 RsmB/NOP family class I SAM-dependent RNA methyltransferase [Campylobacter hepaticus]MCZ0775333.1 RsmB/NOP family class I SAM-dependent RNA methyltransferase [Campylobacter hepaticus]MDX2323045.1 RsmB/NO